MHRTTATALAAALALTLAGCGESTSGGAGAASSSPAPSASVDAPAAASSGEGSAAGEASTAGITLQDGWAKATEGRMTGVFGTLRNAGDEEIVITGARSDAAGAVELHVTKDGTMSKVDGGFAVPAGGSRELAPGADHIMLMRLTGPVEAGDEVTITLLTQAGAEIPVTVTARTFAGGAETYHPGAGASSGASASHG